MTHFKVLKAQSNGSYYKIVEDLPDVGWYFYVFNKNGECIKDYLQNDLESALEYAEVEYSVGRSEWSESRKRTDFTIYLDDTSETLDSPSRFSVVNYRFRVAPLIIWCSFIFVGIVFKVMHWPGSAILILFTTAGLTAWTVSDAYFLQGKNWTVNSMVIGGVLWVLFMLWGIFFNDGYPYNFDGLLMYFVVFSIYALIYFIIKSRKMKRVRRSNI